MDLNQLELILIILLSVSESLSLIPGVKSNSVIELLSNSLKTAKERSKQIKELIGSFKDISGDDSKKD